MYMQELPETLFTTTKVKIKYDCDCKIEREMKWVDANKNFTKNNSKHICKKCWLKSDDNPSKKPEVQMKIAATIDEKYGGVLPMNSQEAIESRKQQFEDPNFVEQRNKKRIKTSIERYGAEHHMKTDTGKNAQKEAMIAKYGVEHPLQSPEIIAKMLQTVQERHGVNNVMQIPEVMEKQQQSTFDAYGVKHYNQLPEAKEYLRENCTTWLADSYANPWAKGITRPEEWNERNRQAVKDAMANGRWNGGYLSNTRGRFPAWKCKKDMPYFLSSLELKFHYWLNHDPSVEFYNYEGLCIEYIKPADGRLHLYYPDFQVKYFDDDTIHVQETKTYKDKDNSTVLAKQDAAINYCNKNNMRYSLLFDDQVDNLVKIDYEIIKDFPGIIWEQKK